MHANPFDVLIVAWALSLPGSDLLEPGAEGRAGTVVGLILLFWGLGKISPVGIERLRPNFTEML